MRLIDYMRSTELDDDAMAALVGDITGHGIRKLKYGERSPSIEVAIRINNATDGKVGLQDWARAEHSSSLALAAPEPAQAPL